MDKYQKKIVETEEKNVFFDCISQKYSQSLANGFDYDKDVYTLTQEDDIFSVKYNFTIKANANIEACFCLVNGEWKGVSASNGAFIVELDFEKRIENIYLTFKDNIADNYAFSVNYIEADKEKYYAQKEKELRQERLKAASIGCATGIDLVNVYFQPCCDMYRYTEIQLYVLKETSEWSFITKRRVNEEDFYFSIGGLAYGIYSFVLKQFDSNGNILLETNNVKFRIGAPASQSNYVVV